MEEDKVCFVGQVARVIGELAGKTTPYPVLKLCLGIIPVGETNDTGGVWKKTLKV